MEEKDIELKENFDKIKKTVKRKVGKGYVVLVDKLNQLTEEEKEKILIKYKRKSLSVVLLPKVVLKGLRKKQKSDLQVVTDAKKIMQYVFTITNKSPKKFRFSFVSKLQNYSINVLENIYKASQYRADIKETYKLRNFCQREAYTFLKMLSYFSFLAVEQNCILRKEYVNIATNIHNCLEQLLLWMENDKVKNRD